MRYPTIPPREVTAQGVQVFRGYNRNLKIKAGEFRDMENLTSDAYPVLSPRGKRGIYRKPASPQGLIAKEALCCVDGADFLLGDQRIAMGLSVEPERCPKDLISMGAYVIILPDKMYINTAYPEDFGSIEASNTVSGAELTLCDGEGTPLSWITQPPEEPENGALWMDGGSLKQYSASMSAWIPVTDTTVKLSAPGIGTGFLPGDTAELSGCAESGLNGYVWIVDAGEAFVLVKGMLSRNFTQEQALTLKREMPDMDYVTQAENRLWGCRYGTDSRGKPVNELYASKLGDFRNWNCFQGLSTDSYRASCGSDGPFTGAATHLGYPLFFREGCLHKIYGSEPASFRIQTTACRGVQAGCHRSLAVVGDTLMYKSPTGVCAYDGALPVEISQALGRERYGNAAAGAIGDKYYISMEDEAGAYHLFVYDRGKKLWHREDNLSCAAFCAWGGELFAIDRSSRNILGLLGSGEPEGPVSWMAQTGELGMDPARRQYISRLNLRLALERGSELECLIEYDDSGQWESLCRVFGTELRSFRIPLRVRRCDHMRLRFQGTGGAKLYSLTKILEKGSDL